MKNYLHSNNIKYDSLMSFENGIGFRDDNSFCDICYFYHYDAETSKFYINHSPYDVVIPEKFYNLCLEFKQEKTIGEIIQEQT
jgi:hypothetical protein